ADHQPPGESAGWLESRGKESLRLGHVPFGSGVAWTGDAFGGAGREAKQQGTGSLSPRADGDGRTDVPHPQVPHHGAKRGSDRDANGEPSGSSTDVAGLLSAKHFFG